MATINPVMLKCRVRIDANVWIDAKVPGWEVAGWPMPDGSFRAYKLPGKYSLAEIIQRLALSRLRPCVQ